MSCFENIFVYISDAFLLCLNKELLLHLLGDSGFCRVRGGKLIASQSVFLVLIFNSMLVFLVKFTHLSSNQIALLDAFSCFLALFFLAFCIFFLCFLFSLYILWSGIGVKIKVAFHCTGLAFYAVLFEFNVASVAFSCSVAN